MMKNIRILPFTVVALVLICGLKLSTVWTDAQGFFVQMSISEVRAEEQKAEETEQVAAVDAEAKPESEVIAETETTEAKSNPQEQVASTQQQFSASEIEVLERLVERRDELDRRIQELDMRENLLKAAESKIDNKISQLKEMEATLKELLQLHDTQEKEQLASLVKIYEKMKPKDAARIFNSLEMDILINVAGEIKEAKMAAILASMNIQRANKLTVELANRRQLPGIDDTKS
jgi:flagellar motility protein MotE (MotC chaperone)